MSVTRNEPIAPDQWNEPNRPLLPMALRAPCPLCADIIELMVDDQVTVSMKPTTSADNWNGHIVRISASGSTIHYHRR